MKTTVFTKIAAIMILALGILVTSCDKANDEDVVATLNVDVDEELYTAEVFDEVIEISDEAMDLYESQGLKSTEVSGFTRLGECVTITQVIADKVKTTTIDFGEENCLCADERERRGKIIIIHDGSYWDTNVVITAAFDEYFVDDNQVLGAKEVVQLINENGNREMQISIVGTIIWSDGSGETSWSAERFHEIIEGSDTPRKWDDVTETTGSASWTLYDGSEGSEEIVAPLERRNEAGCIMYPVRGIREINKVDGTKVIIDYGDGTCDKYAEVTKDGITEVTELKRKRPFRF